MSIEESNKLIAEFMGLIQNPHNERLYAINPEYIDGQLYAEKWECLKYFTSWHWLMPVVEKIESTYDEKHGYFGVYISSNSCTIQGTNFRSDKNMDLYFAQYEGVTKIAATHHAVTNFIQWYNKTLK